MESNLWKVLRFAAILGSAASSSLAQSQSSAPASSQSDEPVVLSNVVVTGSNLPAPAIEADKPVQEFGPASIADSGVETDLAGILRKVSPMFTGNGNVGTENAQSEAFFTQGGSFLQIHNLTTLVLIDGRRVAFDPAEAGLGGQFVDLNMIPPSAIERIEIVSDGASAIYGSDAVGGVINVILKKDFNGWEIGTHWGESSNRGDYTERSGYLTGGVSDGTTSLLVSVEGSENSPIMMNQRPYSSTIYGAAGYGGIVSVNPINLQTGQSGPVSYYQLNPSLNAPPGYLQYSMPQLVQMGVYSPVTAQQVQTGLNVAPYQTLLESLKRWSAVSTFDHKIFGDSLAFFGDLLYGRVRTQSQVVGESISPYVSAPFTDPLVYGTSPPPPGSLAYVPYIPFTNLNSPFSPTWLYQGTTINLVNVDNLFANYPVITHDDSDLFRFSGGFKGKVGDSLTWEVGVDANRYHLAYTGPGQIDTADLNAALAAGTFNPFAVTQAAGSLPGGVIGTKSNTLVSTLYSEDFLVRDSIFDLPSGKVEAAVGGSYTREALSAAPDPTSQSVAPGLSVAGWLDSQSLEPFDASRGFTSFYGELKVPLIGAAEAIPFVHSLTLDLAGRYDNYSQVGHSTVPSAGLNYEPFDDRLSFRASVGRSFGAPELYQLFGPAISGPIPPFTYQSYYGFQASGAGMTGYSGSNPELQPFKANTWSAGFVYAPKAINGLDLSFDFFGASVTGAVGYLSQAEIVQSVELEGPASPFAQYVHVGGPTAPGVTGPGQLSTANPSTIYVQVPLLNLASQLDRGVDATLDYAWNWPSVGQLKFSSTATVWNTYLVQETRYQSYYDYVGTASSGGSNSQGTIPQWRLYSTLDWTRGDYGLSLAHTYIPSVNDIGAGGSSASAPVSVGAYQQLDAFATWDLTRSPHPGIFGKLKFRLGVDNLFNRMPPYAPNAFPATNADVGDYNGPIGRLYFADATLHF